MPRPITALSHTEPDANLLDALVKVRRGCLGVVVLVSAVILAGWALPGLDRILPNGWQLMKASTAIAALMSAVSLELSESRRSRLLHLVSLVLAVLVMLLGAIVLAAYVFHFPVGIDRWLLVLPGPGSPFAGRMAPQTAAGFTLLGASMATIAARTRVAAHLADLLAFLLFLVVLVLSSGYIFGAIRLFDFSPGIMTSPQTLLCLALLTAVALTRRAEHGVFAIFLRRGIAGATARTLSPILLVLPILREVARARLIQRNVIPPHYVTALLASTATVLSILLLLYLAWRINDMETEIRDLSLRDDLTSLYNLKGFTLLAEQALRLARRAQLPFSVLFIDLDDLKYINDQLGHGAGSAYLLETGDVLLATFRASDVLGRVGGDEFAVAGQFSPAAVAIAEQRLQAAVAARNIEAGRRLPLSLSVGFVTSDADAHDSLKDMIARADRAMYKEKRRRKAPPD